MRVDPKSTTIPVDPWLDFKALTFEKLQRDYGLTFSGNDRDIAEAFMAGYYQGNYPASQDCSDCAFLLAKWWQARHA